MAETGQKRQPNTVPTRTELVWEGKYDEPKTSSSRRAIVIPGSLLEALREHQMRQIVEGPASEAELVFPNQVGRPMDPHQVICHVLWPEPGSGG